MPGRARAAVAALALALLATLAFGSVPGSPFQPVLPGEPSGPLVWLGRVVGAGSLASHVAPFVGAVLLAITAAAFAWALVEARAGRVPTRTILALAVAAHVAVLAAPLLFSRDVYSYAVYGRIAAVHGENPYLATPASFPDDPLVAFVGPKWIDTPAVYGPAFTGLASLVARVATTPASLVEMFRVLAVVASLATLAVVGWLARRLAPGREAFALLLYGANPVVLLHAVAGGHNDVLVGLGVAGGVALLAQGRRTAAVAAIALAALVKATAAVPLLLLLVAIAGAAGAGRRVRALAAPVGAASALLVATAAPFFSLRDPTFGLRELATHEGWLAPSRVLRRLLDVVGLGGAARSAFAVLLVLAIAALAVATWRRASVAAGDVGASVGWGLLAVLFLSPVLLPWYAAWILPVAWMLPRRARTAAVGVSLALAVSLFAAEPVPSAAAYDVNLLIGRWGITPVVIGFLVVVGMDLRARLRAGIDLREEPGAEADGRGER